MDDAVEEALPEVGNNIFTKKIPMVSGVVPKSVGGPNDRVAEDSTSDTFISYDFSYSNEKSVLLFVTFLRGL